MIIISFNNTYKLVHKMVLIIYLLVTKIVFKCGSISYPPFVHAVQENINGLGSNHTMHKRSVMDIFHIALEPRGALT